MTLSALVCLAALTQPSPLERLDFLSGDWDSKEVTSRADGSKVEFTLRGKNRWTLRKTFMRIEETFELPGQGPQENLILMTYDARDKVYRAWWYHAAGPKPLEFTGTFADGLLTLTTDPPPPASPLRITYRPKAPGHFDATLEVRIDGKWTERTRAIYTRKQ